MIGLFTSQWCGFLMMLVVPTLLFGGGHLAWAIYRRIHGLPWPGRWNVLMFLLVLSVSINIGMPLATHVCRATF